MAAPVFEINFLLNEGECLPVGPSHDDLNTTSTSSLQTTLPVQLTHLSFLTPVSEQAAVALNPVLVATFSHSPSVIASLDQTQPHQNPFSIISRWEYDSQSENRLHTSLDQLASSKKPKPSDVGVNSISHFYTAAF
jgi:mediator of RNA polymerase II transcription subunit 16, fungi type